MSKGQKLPHAEVLLTAQRIEFALRPFCERIEIAGSLRRMRPFVGDIEIVAIPQRPVDLFGIPQLDADTALDRFLIEKQVRMTKNGRKYKQFTYGKFKVDLFLPETAAHWGSIFLVRTGSHEFNMWLMAVRAKQLGLRFADGLLYDNGRVVDTYTEEAVFAALQMEVVPPTDRDDNRWLAYLKDKVTSD